MASSAGLVARDTVRRLEAGDYAKGYLSLLSKLSTVGEVSEASFVERLRFLDSEGRGQDYVILVVEDQEGKTVMATGSLIVEHKFIHECGMVGHVEDVVVLPDARGQGLGLRIVSALIEEATKRGCYKVLLDCDEKNVGFYEKAGMKRKEVQMVKYL